MLSNYDAKAIAELMGLAFVRQPAKRTESADSKTASAGADRDIVIRAAGDTMLVVDAKSGRQPAASGGAKTSGRSRSAGARHVTSSPSATFIEKAVSGGLPRHALRHVAEALAGADKSRVSAYESDVVPKTTLDRRTSRLSVGESERTERIARMFVHARRALGTDDEAREFMTTPHPELDGRSPLDATATDLGARHAEQILNALEYGLAL